MYSHFVVYSFVRGQVQCSVEAILTLASVVGVGPMAEFSVSAVGKHVVLTE